ncbi:hypothetical protein HDK90DRAFT_256000 [Phyllosticta capitalensis]|uniref:Uncharacterized protein n=1 Tax=Phyllosticta capitalensis TaxID=121624 RepID=A0ABR1YQQ5_9PEZI
MARGGWSCDIHGCRWPRRCRRCRSTAGPNQTTRLDPKNDPTQQQRPSPILPAVPAAMPCHAIPTLHYSPSSRVGDNDDRVRKPCLSVGTHAFFHRPSVARAKTTQQPRHLQRSHSSMSHGVRRRLHTSSSVFLACSEPCPNPSLRSSLFCLSEPVRQPIETRAPSSEHDITLHSPAAKRPAQLMVIVTSYLASTSCSCPSHFRVKTTRLSTIMRHAPVPNSKRSG